MEATEQHAAPRLRADIEALVACGPRLAGSPAERAAADYITGELRRAGLSPDLVEWDAWISLPGAARVETGDGRVIAARGTAFAADSGPDGVIGPLRSLDAPGSLEGAIALAKGLPHLSVLRQAAARGARGVVAVSADDRAHYWQISPLWGSPEIGEDLEQLASIPALQVGARDGAALAALAISQVPVRLVAPVASGWRRLVMPTVHIAGREPGEILIGGHYCSWGPGATDNAAGNALMLDIARHYAAGPPPRFGLRLCWWTGHEQGGYAGSAHFADLLHEELAARAFAYVSVDNVGSRGAALWQVQNTGAELDAFATAIRDRIAPVQAGHDAFAASLLPLRQDRGIPASRPARNGDQSFCGIGLASVQIASWLGPESADRIPGTGLPTWWHTDEDLPEHCDGEVLLRDRAIHLALVEGLVNGPVLPLDPAAQARDLIAALQILAEAAPEAEVLAGLVERARRYLRMLETAGRGAGLTDDQRIATVKALNPVLFHAVSSTRFDMTRANVLLPGLHAAADWRQAGPDERSRRRVGLRRAANRVTLAIATAERALDPRGAA